MRKGICAIEVLFLIDFGYVIMTQKNEANIVFVMLLNYSLI